MTQKWLIRIGILLIVVLLLGQGSALAQGYTVTGRPVSSAQAMGGGDFTLSGSAGQPEAATALSGGGFTLEGGTEFEGMVMNSYIYLPLMLK